MPHLTSAGWDDPVVRQPTAAQLAGLRGRHGPDSEPGVPPSATDVAVVLVALGDGGTPVGCGALRPPGPDSAEVERMYVVPAARRRTAASGHHVRPDQDWSLHFRRRPAVREAG